MRVELDARLGGMTDRTPISRAAEKWACMDTERRKQAVAGSFFVALILGFGAWISVTPEGAAVAEWFAS